MKALGKEIKFFSEIGKNDLGIVGGKGLNLGIMTSAQFPVPPGFVITTQAYYAFLDETKLREQINHLAEAIDVDTTEELEEQTAKIRKLVREAHMPMHVQEKILQGYHQLKGKSQEFYVAVRSSATAEDLASISENEYVFVNLNGNPFFGKMKELADIAKPHDVILVPAMNNFEVKWQRVSNIYQHKTADNRLYQITTATGKQITLTPNHSLIVLDEKTFQPKVAELTELQVNQKVPVIKHLPGLTEVHEINLLEHMSSDNTSEHNGKILIKNKSTNWTIQQGLPKKIKITKDLAYFLGIYAAEGSTYEENNISITNKNAAIIHQTKKALQELDINCEGKINKHSLRVYCKSLVRFLHENCGQPDKNIRGKGKLCHSKQVPSFIFASSPEIIGEYLKGCFDGDGTVHTTVQLSSTSEKLIAGISTLLQVLEMECYIRKNISNNPKWHDSFELTIPYKELVQFKTKVGFIHPEKAKKLNRACENYAQKEKHPEFKNSINVSRKIAQEVRDILEEHLPKQKSIASFCPNCGKIIQKTSLYKNQARYYCAICKKAFYEPDVVKTEVERYINYDEQGQFLTNSVPWNKSINTYANYGLTKFKETLSQIGALQVACAFSESITWDRIIKIEEIENNAYVYDFCVPNVENFAAGLGGIITHNSASFAGQQETYLNVHGDKDLIQRVKDCWASLFTARATYYRRKQGFETSKVGIAVVVQKMVNSEQSGIMFTADPTTSDVGKIMVEAGYGLGEAIVSGSVTPDTIIVDKKEMNIIHKNISRQEWKFTRKQGKNKKEIIPVKEQQKQKVSDEHIIEIARVGKKIEDYYQHPQDIEWALEKNTVYIVQTRAITTLSSKEKVKTERERVLGTIKAEKLVQGLAASPGIGTGKVVVALSVKQAEKIKAGEILVTKMTEPAWVPLMKKAAAIVTDEGGVTAHAAIISRELGIPCVVGSSNATHVLKTGQEVTVNGYNGTVYAGKIQIILPKTVEEQVIRREEIPDLLRALHLTQFEKTKVTEKEMEYRKKEIIQLLEKIACRVKVNVALPDAAKRAAHSGAQGVGLLRAEHMIAMTNQHPAQYLREGDYNGLVKVVKTGIRGVANAFKGYPVWYRTFDARTDEFTMLKGGDKEPKEANPMMGWHGIRRDLDQPELLRAQLQAVHELYQEGYTNVGIMLPFVINASEVRKVKEIAQTMGIELGARAIKFGVMVETPAACWILDDLVKEGIQFISFGTNDLTQLTLGIDRNNQRIQQPFSEQHPAILGQIQQVIEKCKMYGIETSICGQAGSNPEMVKKLVHFGINSVSANIDAVQKIKNTVLAEEKGILLEKLKNKRVSE